MIQIFKTIQNDGFWIPWLLFRFSGAFSKKKKNSNAEYKIVLMNFRLDTTKKENISIKLTIIRSLLLPILTNSFCK